MFRNPSCPICRQHFGTKDPAHHQGPRTPLLLRCGHTYCEPCLTKLAKQAKNNIVCPSCRYMTLVEGQEGSVKTLSPDTYILGILASNRRRTLDIDVSVNYVQAGQRTKDSKDPDVELCCECTYRPASCRCAKCDCNMCGLCFEKVHQTSKVLRRHQAVPIQDSFVLKPCNCPEHDGKPVEYFCEDDQTPICAHCVVVGSHKGHAITAMEEKNKKAVMEIEPALGEAWIILQRMKKSDKMLTATSPESQSGKIQLMEDIRGSFILLHGMLQAREKKIMDDVSDLFVGNNTENLRTTLLDEMHTLESSIRRAESLLSDSQSVVVNAQHILDQLRAAKSMPCYLLKGSDDGSKTLSFCVEPEIRETLSKVGTLEGKPQAPWALVSVDEVPESLLEADQDTFIPYSAQDQMSTSSLGTGTESASASAYSNGLSAPDSDMMSDSASVTSNTSSTATSGATKGRKKKLRKNTVQFGHEELVYITHIKNPCQFMVQKCSDFERLKSLSRNIQHHCKNLRRGDGHLNTVEQDDIVLAQYTDKTWYRSRVLSVDPGSEDGQGDAATTRVEILYIDYGNTEVTTLSKLRVIISKFMKIPPMATQCLLLDLVPSGETGQWSKESVHAFAKMTGDKPMLLKLVSQEDNILVVDLSKPPTDSIADDRPVSVRDALVFLELACFHSEKSAPLLETGRPPLLEKQFLKPALPRVRECADVLISHVDSPQEFYIQQIGDEACYINELMSNLQQWYMADKNDLYTVFCPHLRQICVGRFSQDDQWYRAQVVSLPGRRQVLVQYVDFGNKELLPYWHLKKIMDNFCILPAQAVQCQLADVEPVNPKAGWSEQARAYFRGYANKQMVIRVKDILDGGSLSVVLFDVADNKEDCLNSLLVVEGLARSIGPGSEPVRSSSQQPYPPRPSPQTELPSAGNNQVPPLESLNSDEDLDTTLTIDTGRKKSPKEARRTDIKTKKPSQIEVRVSHIVSPGELYVQAAHTKPLDNLMSELNAHYENSEPEVRTWEPQELCAALYEKTNKWYRARFNKLLTEKKAEVVLFDHGMTAQLSLNALRTLDDQFKSLPCMSLCCHLEDIQPAGDITKWSQTSCDYIREMVDAEETCYLIMKGEAVNSSQPIELLVEEYIKGDALTADGIEYKSISQMILGKGLALPKRRTPSRSCSETPNSTPRGIPPPLTILDDDKQGMAVFKVHTLPKVKTFDGVATYVNMEGVIFVQDVHDELSPQGRLGHLLQEHTIEILIQDAYLASRGLHRAKIPRDGNCMFRAVAAGLYADQAQHTELRKGVVQSLRENWEIFGHLVPETEMRDYVDQMEKDGMYCGELEIQALCWTYDVQIMIFLGGLHYPVQMRQYGNSTNPLLQLIYLSDGHYDSGHYDLATDSLEGALRPEEVYRVWRERKVREYEQGILAAGTGHYDATVYDESILAQLMNILQERYHSSQAKPDAQYQVGQAVIAQYTDGDFYRATITGVTEKGYKVFYIDFGNSEVLTTDRLRDEVILTEIPQCTYPCIIHDVKPNTPDGKWTVPLLDKFHEIVVNKKCTVHIQEPPVLNSSLKVSVTLEGGIDLGQDLQRMGIALDLEEPLPLPPPEEFTSQGAKVVESEVTGSELTGSVLEVTGSSGSEVLSTPKAEKLVVSDTPTSESDMEETQLPPVGDIIKAGQVMAVLSGQLSKASALQLPPSPLPGNQSPARGSPAQIMNQSPARRSPASRTGNQSPGKDYQSPARGSQSTGVQSPLTANGSPGRGSQSLVVQSPLTANGSPGRGSKAQESAVQCPISGSQVQEAVNQSPARGSQPQVAPGMSPARVSQTQVTPDISPASGSLDHVTACMSPDRVSQVQESTVRQAEEPEGAVEEEGWLDPAIPPARTMPCPYPIMETLGIGNVMGCSVTQIEDGQHVYLQRVRMPRADVPSLLSINQELFELEQLTEKINCNFMDYRRLQDEEICSGRACCAQFSADMRWYRAEILSVRESGGESLVSVIYVDYGNWEWVTTDRLRLLPWEHLSLAAQALRVRLASTDPDQHRGEEFKGRLVSELVGRPLTAVFKVSKATLKSILEDPEVELFDEETFNRGMGHLVYQPVLDWADTARRQRQDSSGSAIVEDVYEEDSQEITEGLEKLAVEASKGN